MMEALGTRSNGAEWGAFIYIIMSSCLFLASIEDIRFHEPLGPLLLCYFVATTFFFNQGKRYHLEAKLRFIYLSDYLGSAEK